MTVIFKRQSLDEVLRGATVTAATRGTQRNLIARRCILCRLPFETLAHYPKQTCSLRRYENAEDGAAYLKNNREPLNNVEAFYKHFLAKGISLENKKRRAMRASGCKVTNWATCERLKDFESYLDPISEI